MNRMFGLPALVLAGAMSGLVLAQAEVPLSILEQAGGLPTLAPVFAKVSPSVVSIKIDSHTFDARNAAGKNRGSPKPATQAGETRAGSGVIFDGPRGLIITNNHVIEHADEIAVTVIRGRRLPATLVGADPETDVAVIKVQPEDLTAIPFSDSDRLRIGDFVITIGIPFPIGRTMTSGIVSALHRSNVGIARAEDLIQTDASIYPGDSGGALVNLRGELVGINAGYVGPSNTNSGVGFAIPSNLARKVVDQILAHGGVRRGMLGISYADPKASLIRGMKLTVSRRPVIDKVDAGSAAERAGLKTGDVVIAVDGAAVRDADELQSKLGLDWLGDTVELTVSRAGQSIVIHAAMEELRRARSK